MASENNKVTLTFGGYDDTHDNTLMFEGPIAIAGSVTNVSDLPTWWESAKSQYNSGDDVIVYVRNVNSEQGDLLHRGSFYKYLWEKAETGSPWQQLMLGNHSHSNMEILDQLGEINTDSLQNGDKRVIVLEKIADDPDNIERKYTYKLSYKEFNEIPEVPPTEKKLQLIYDPEEGIKWSDESFTVQENAQQFKFLTITLAADNIVRFTGSVSGSNKLILDKTYLDLNLINVDDVNDEVLVFDSGKLVQNIIYALDESNNLVFTITDNTNIFELGENISVLFIHSGNSQAFYNGQGITVSPLNESTGGGVTRNDLRNILSNYTTLSKLNTELKKYVRTETLKNYALTSHTHSEYLKKTDTHYFDFRYADYQHTHTEYISKLDVLAILTNICDADGEISEDFLENEILDAIRAELNELRNNVYTKSQISDYLASEFLAKLNARNIVYDVTGDSIHNYLVYLSNKLDSVTRDNKASDIVLEHDINVNLGTGNSVGGIGSDTYFNTTTLEPGVIPSGTSIETILNKLLTKEVIPELIQPELSVDYDIVGEYDTESGSEVNIHFTPVFTQNDAGVLTELEYEFFTPYFDENGDLINMDDIEIMPTQILNGEEIVLRQKKLEAKNSDGLCYIIKVKARYATGQNKESNIPGNFYRIDSGELVKEIKIYCKRLAYVGYTSDSFKNLTATGVRDYLDNNFQELISTHQLFSHTLNDDDDLVHGLKYLYEKENYDDESLARTLIFAIPETSEYKISKIIYDNQNFDMRDDYSMAQVELRDASFELNNKLNNLYKVYYYTLAKPVQSSIGITYCIERK